jgi:hypothetical protein
MTVVQTDAQLLKAFGHMPNVPVDDIPDAAALVDPTTATLVTENRFCIHPDIYDEEIAKYDDPEKLSNFLGFPTEQCGWLIEAHKRMEATGSGSWPAGCYEQYPNNHACTYFLERDTFPDHYKRPVSDEELEQIVTSRVWRWSREQVFDMWSGKPMLDVAMDLVNETYRLVGCAHIEKTDGPNGQHNIHIKSVPIPGSTIGVAWFNDGTCGDHVNHHIDSGYRPSLHPCAMLLAHEAGHNHDLPHTFTNQNSHRGIMSYRPKYPFVGYSTGEAPYDRPRDPSWPQLIRQYGGEPVPIDDPDPPPTPKTKIEGEIEGEVLDDGRVRINGTVVAENVEHTPVWTGEPGSLKYKFEPKV